MTVLNPLVLALLGVSLVDSIMMLIAGVFAFRIVRRWDLGSASEGQLALERKTYLISTLLAWVFAAELLSLLLFVHNAERMSGQFVGAMCATGVLNVNGFGWPTLILKILLFFLCATWLILNRIDNTGLDYPLVRPKYLLLLATLPVMVAQTAVQFFYFLNMDPNIITSCCGSLFSPVSDGLSADLAAMSPGSSMSMMYATGLALFAAGLWFLGTGKGGMAFAGLAAIAFVAALTAIISLVSVYIYEQPHHHCPFCILKAGYAYVGYLLYTPLFAAAALGLAVGALHPFRATPSLVGTLAAARRRLALSSLAGFCLFYAVATHAILRSNLELFSG